MQCNALRTTKVVVRLSLTEVVRRSFERRTRVLGLSWSCGSHCGKRGSGADFIHVLTPSPPLIIIYSTMAPFLSLCTRGVR